MQRARSHGFTLIEVLVALFVLALGVAGAAGTQLSSARLRQQAALESEAVQLAASLGARMRVNAAQMALPDASNPYLGFAYDAAGGAPDAPPVQCFGAACNPAQLAAFDLYEAARIVQDAFPGGRIAVCRDAGGWNAALQAFEWTCSGGAGAPVVVKLGWQAPGASTAQPRIVMVVAA
ncbi:type IV pilus modification protein PilV [Massilia sp. Mn16-1_5]|uniref:type IV pilus modification protein PilV n=1 Tax=Massilia sp. Mn16-1_5 TaxID=2079199 RepID=UPI00109E8510|nr:type IV pilus modification protein PilV [Massilia sp. Mn16-1_5]THC46864.1 type IV pilus modification protein PilV [Massilia sp. Mn16-1_5]